MELLLYRWSTLVQVTSDLMIALFFVVLSRSVGRSELRAWVGGWMANLVALAITVGFWLLQPRANDFFAVVTFGYTFAKNLFIVLLVCGVARFAGRDARRIPWMPLIAGTALLSLVVAAAVPSIDVLGTVESLTIGLGLGVGTVFILVARPPAYGWLAAGFAVRSLLATGEGTVFAMQVHSGSTTKSPALAEFVAAHSSFDTGAEWMMALGCVLVLYRTIQQELVRSNGELQSARDELQALLDRDQLTGVFNRRALPAILRTSQVYGATILFFDLDDFKAVNDNHGHHVGDECLKRFARALQESFRSGDHVVRYAGDEFIVVAPGIHAADVAACIELVRGHLRFTPAGNPQIDFSVGIAQLSADDDPEAALRAADEAMYRDKAA
ncbi:MAG TPA: GGDEF domain-containing protein [Xanthomonadaceae bacterium]|jgi:diguanylate cyclase (GGDEF)-like protein